MPVLLPTQLPSVLEYNNFVSTHNFYTDAVFFTSISVAVTAVTVHARNTSNLLIVVGNVNTAGVLTGTFLGTGNSIRISGYHFGNFDYENWKYRKTKPDATEYTVPSYTQLPDQYFSLWNFTADVRTTTTINISVQTSAGNFTLTQTLYNNWDVGRDNMKRLVYLSDINRFTSSILATSSLTYLSGIGLVAPILTFDGTTSALSTWVNQGATIDSTTGLATIPSFKVRGGRYAYTSVSIGSFLNKTITFNVNLTSGFLQLANVFFGTNAAGAGPFLRLDARNSSGTPSGFSTSTSWTAWTAPTIPNSAIPVSVPPGIWNRVAINITSSNVASWYLNNEFKGSSTVNLTGTNIAIHGDASFAPDIFALGGNFDDLTIWQNITADDGGGGGGGGGTSSGGVFTFSAQILTSTQNYDIRAAAVTSGWDQVLPLNASITVANGVYVWSDTTSTAALVTGSTFPVGSTISIVNNGFIMGKGGAGTKSTGGAAGPAMSLGYNISLTNNSYIAGGGGGGGSGGAFGASGGGGAGGGAGINANGDTAIAGGAIGSVGNTGNVAGTVIGGPNPGGNFGGSGASGGRILPGTGGTGGPGGFGAGRNFGGAGGAGGGGGGFLVYGFLGEGTGNGGDGGSANNAGSNASGTAGAGGGGGGWGAAGGTSGGAGGKAIALNGYTVTYVVTGTIYGAVS